MVGRAREDRLEVLDRLRVAPKSELRPSQPLADRVLAWLEAQCTCEQHGRLAGVSILKQPHPTLEQGVRLTLGLKSRLSLLLSLHRRP